MLVVHVSLLEGHMADKCVYVKYVPSLNKVVKKKKKKKNGCDFTFVVFRSRNTYWLDLITHNTEENKTRKYELITL